MTPNPIQTGQRIRYVFGAATLVIAGIVALVACNPRDLVPDSLLSRPTQYAQTAVPAQTATHAALFQQPSRIEFDAPGVRTPPPPGAVLTNTSQVAAVRATPRPAGSLPSAATATLVAGNPPLPTPPSVVPKTTAAAATAPVTGQPTSLPTAAATATRKPGLPVVVTATAPPLVAVMDIVSDTLATQQARKDAIDDGYPLRDATVSIDPAGLTLTGTLWSPPLVGAVRTSGRLVIVDEALKYQATTLTFNGRNYMNTPQRAQTENAITTSLYRLLPGRRVQAFALEQARILVNSNVQP